MQCGQWNWQKRWRLDGVVPGRAVGVFAAVLLLIVGNAHAQGSVAGDRAALEALYNATDGANWTDNTNWLSTEALSGWHGVVTDTNGRVTEVSLAQNELTGQIPSELEDLTNLITLYLGQNQLTGEIPSELGQLSNLEELQLGPNQLTGEIPSGLEDLTNLITLFLNGNQLTGEIPSELGQLSNLTTLFLNWNQLTGEIPSELGQLTNLQSLYLGQNQLTGEIPSELGDLTNLIALYLRTNQLTGEIPAELGQLSNLWVLDLGQNQLTGEILSELGQLTNLQSLYLGQNQLTGEIPSELVQLSNLQSLYLGQNQLTGEIPSELVQLSNLEDLHLRYNQLTGEIPAELGQLSNLEDLYLDNNQLTGEIPAELGDMTNLVTLLLGENQLTGEIPSELVQLSNLESLYLNHNQLTGEILSELGDMTNLRVLHLDHNQLTGEIPSELVQLSNLESLYLSQNQLTGEIPSELGDITNLRFLGLDENQLTGEIPSELVQLSNLESLYLSQNQLTGEILSELGDMTNLTTLDLNENQLTGEIPSELGQLTNLITLYLDNNQLTGEIPSELGDLTHLRRLHLHENQLTGEIPSELGDLTKLSFLYLDRNQLTGEIPSELGDLTNLRALRLQRNQLTGEIPSELGDLTNLQYLLLHENQLTGEIPSELGQLTNLEYLFLDGNQLTGEIPAELGDLAALVELSLWGNQLTGEIPSGLVLKQERAVLRVLYNGTGGANWTDKTNWLSTDALSTWYGVSTDGQGRVTQLILHGNGLTGQIPSALENLTNLQYLDLSDNMLSGEIPSELGNLAALVELSLGGNQLTGGIPSELEGVVLQELSLRSKQFTGQISSALEKLTNLQYLDLSDNMLSGEIPEKLGDLTNLRYLGLSDNQLTGEIPSELGQLSNLEQLDLGENQLTGEIPSELGQLSNLEQLDLGENQLTGEIPSELGQLSNLEQLSLNQNQLTGGIPAEVEDLPALQEVSLWNNQLTGEIPSELVVKQERAVLRVLYNGTGGEDWTDNTNWLSNELLSEWYGVFTDGQGRVEELRLSANGLAGTIPPEVENLTQLEVFDISNTQITCVRPGSPLHTWLATIDFRGAICPRPRQPGGGGGGGGGGLVFPPEAPAALMATAGDGVVRLEWSPPESDGGSPIQRYEYRLKDGRAEFGEWTPIEDSAVEEVNASGYTVMDLGNGTVYVFELRAVNAAGRGRVSEAVEVMMPLDPAYWSNFRAEDLEGVELMLEAFLLEGSSRDRELRFGEGMRFEQDELDGDGEVTATLMGSYGYRYTSRTTGELSLDLDGGEACRLRLTFTGEGAGSYSYRCGGSSRGQGSFRMSELENRVPEITSTGPFEVEENTTAVGQLEAVDWDEEDEVTGYATAGGADGALFRVDEQTGELSFTEAPDFENPEDVASEDPHSAAGDNEYILVVEVTSGEGERERTREQAIRVWVRDVEMEEAGEEGEEERESLFIPVILSSAGRNQSFFTSELTLTNRGDEEVELHYTYTAEAGGGSGTASDVLPSGSQKIETDALTYLRGLGTPIPEEGNRIGTLRVEAPLGSEVEAVVRTTTEVPDGRAGLAYLGIAGEAGFDEPVYLCGLRQNSQDRSNVAIQHMGRMEEGSIRVRATVFSGDPETSGGHVLEDRTLLPGGFYQYNGILDMAGFDNGYVKVERVEGEAPFYAYGVINDQANSDGSFVFPVTASSLEGKTGQTLPVIVETSEFRSELTVTNFSEEPRRLDFEFVAEGIAATGNTVSFHMTLEAGQQEIIPDVVDELRGQQVAGLGRTGGFYAGPLFVVAKGGDMSGIVIGARTGSEGGGGSYSVFYNAVPEGEAFTQEAWVDGLQQNEENRSNLALVNTGEVDGSDSVFHLEIYDGETGMLVETVVTRPVPARRWHQINGILGSYAPETRQGYVRIEKVSGENPFLAYGVVNDGGAPGERSGDGAYVPARE